MWLRSESDTVQVIWLLISTSNHIPKAKGMA
nr:MAG TPA: hypothetical protein [Caudoviricetes sp.]